MELELKKVQGKVKRIYCKKFIETGKLCEPVGWFATIEKCKKCNTLK